MTAVRLASDTVDCLSLLDAVNGGVQDFVNGPRVPPEGGGPRGHWRPLCQVAVAHYHQ